MDKPAQPSTGASPGDSTPSARSDKTKRILLIEDDPTTRVVLLQKFRAAGLDVETASNGNVALDKLHTCQPDAIFMDLLLPQADGTDVIKAARQHPSFGQRPIYVCTSASNMNAWSRRAKKAGATKVFDRASIPIESIIGEVANELTGTASPQKPVSETKREARPQMTESEPEPARVAPASPQSPNRPAATVPQPPAGSLLNRVMKSFGFAGKNDGENRIQAPEQPRTPPAHTTTEGAAAAPSASNPLTTSMAQPQSVPEEHSAGETASSLTDLQLPPASNGVAVLTLNEVATIVAANDACTALFGWDRPSLVGQSLRILLTGDVESELERLVRQQQQAAEQTKSPCNVDVRARRQDGSEFEATVTIMTWCSDTTLTRKSEVAHFTWTALFRRKDRDTDFRGQVGETASADLVASPSVAVEFAPETPTAHEQTARLRQQLEEAKAEVRRAETAYEEEIARTRAVQGELAKLQHGYDDLDGKLSTERQVLDEATRRADHLEEQLRASASECSKIKTELERHQEERGSWEASWREQLSKADAEIKLLKDSWRDEADRNALFEARLRILGDNLKQEQVQRTQRFDDELSTLRHVRDELADRLKNEHAAAAESERRAEELENRLRESAAEVECARAKLDEQTAEHARLEEEWRDKLSATEALTNQLESAWVEAEQRSRSFEEELTGLRQTRDELMDRLAAAQRAMAESMKRNDNLAMRVIENATELERVKLELEKVGGNVHFEERLACLQQIREELSVELRTEQQTTEQSRQHSEELEGRLHANKTELERVKADADRHAEEQARLESELKAQLDVAQQAAEQAEQALKEKTMQCGQFEGQLENLRLGRDELDRKLTSEQQAVTESKQRNQELETRLRENASELEDFRVAAEKQAAEQTRVESDLRAQLDAAKAAIKEEAARGQRVEALAQQAQENQRQEQREHTRQFETELAQLQQSRDELLTKLNTEQQKTAESRTRFDALEAQLRETQRQLERLQAERARSGEERAALELEWRSQLDLARTAAEQKQQALTEKVTECSQFEAELVNLRQERDQLNQTLAAEQQSSAQSQRRSQELEGRLQENASELERVRTDAETQAMEGQYAAAESRTHQESLEQQLAQTANRLERLQAELAQSVEERVNLESELRGQLDTARVATEQKEQALNERTVHCGLLETELGGLRQAREDLSQKLAAERHAAEESNRRQQELETRLRENATALEGLRIDAERQATEAQRAADEAKAQRESLEQQLAETRSRLEQLQTELARHAEERTQLEAELRHQLDAAKTAAEQNEAARSQAAEQLATAQNATARAEQAHQQSEARTRQLELDIQNLRDERHQIYDRFRAEHQAGAKSLQRIQELEKRLREKVGGLKQATAKLKGATATLEVEKDRRNKSEHARAAAERQLVRLREKHAESSQELTDARQAAEEARRHGDALEQRLHENTAEMERVKAELAQHTDERQRLESALGAFADTKKALDTALSELHEGEITRHAEVAEWEGRLHQSAAALARVTTDLEMERMDRHRLEQRAAALADQLHELHHELKQHVASEQAGEQQIAELGQQLRQREDAIATVSLELQREKAGRQSAEQQLSATTRLSEELERHLSLLEEAKKVFARREAELEAQLDASLQATRTNESNLENQTSERRRLEAALEAAQREQQRQIEQSAIAVSKLEAAAHVEQLERKRLEAESAQGRYASVDSTRLGRAMLNSFRKQLRDSVDTLVQTSRSLVGVESPQEQQKLVTTLLEHALLLQSSLQESGGATEENPTARGADERAPARVSRPPGLLADKAEGELLP